MQKLEVLIEENVSGSVRSVEVVASAPVGALVPALVEELQLPQMDAQGKPLIYALRHAAAGTVLPDTATLLASGVAPGERLTLDSYVATGSVPTQNVADPQFYASQTMADFRALPTFDTNAITNVPATTKRGRTTRRAFLLAGVGLLSSGGLALGYAAYKGKLNGLVKFPQKATVPPQQPARTQAPKVQPMVPTKVTPVFTFTQHTQIVRSVSWSANGALLASGGDDSQLYIWGTTGNVQRKIAFPAAARAVAWAADSQRLVVGATNQIVFVNAMNGKILARSTRRHTAMVNSAAWTARNKMQVISGAADNRAIIWNTDTYRAQFTFMRHTTPVEAVSWAPDGQTVATATQAGIIRVWNSINGQDVHGYYLDAPVLMRALAFAPAGMQLAAGGDDGIIRIWNGLTCQQQGAGRFGNQCMDTPQRLQSSKQAVRAVAWSPDARLLATGGNDGMLTLWYPAQGQQPLFKAAQNGAIHSIVWSPDGRQLAVAAGNVVSIVQLA